MGWGGGRLKDLRGMHILPTVHTHLTQWKTRTGLEVGMNERGYWWEDEIVDERIKQREWEVGRRERERGVGLTKRFRGNGGKAEKEREREWREWGKVGEGVQWETRGAGSVQWPLPLGSQCTCAHVGVPVPVYWSTSECGCTYMWFCAHTNRGVLVHLCSWVLLYMHACCCKCMFVCSCSVFGWTTECAWLLEFITT